ncbi:hypothetical protein CR513_05651, partial [Mucuna pruriens]
MAAYIYDDKVLIHYFQDSLIGTTLILYVSLERGHVKTWRDLVEAFLKQYKYNEDMAPDRSRLQSMIKKEHAGFKEYAQRWHELETQVKPPITEREMVIIFIVTLPSPYYNRILRQKANIRKEERRGQCCADRTHLPSDKGKHIFVLHLDTGGIPVSNNTANTIHPTKPTVSRRGDYHQHKANTTRCEKVTQGTSPNSHDLYQKLIEVVPLKPLEPPYPRSYDPNARLLGLKDKGPNVHSNPLLADGVMTVNTISHMDERVEGPNKRKNGESRQAVDSANRVEEGSHPYQLDDITTDAYIEGNGNLQLKPLIIQYNLASKPRVPFIIQVLAKPVYKNNAVPWNRGMTRRGRIFAQEALRSKDPAPAKKERIVEPHKRMVTEE